ncbi:MAG: Fe-S cluster assembly protein SufD [Bacteroidales bacterium]|nr:Fe-S cluster assembly protein SufD [Bacteroidales bacterium]
MSSLLTDNVDISLKYAAHYNDVKESLLKNSPGVLNAPRFKAFQDFVEQGIPTRKNENYKYTNLQPQFISDFQFIHRREPVEIDLNDVLRCDVPKLNTHLAFVYNGWYYEDNQRIGKLPEGVVFDSLEKVAREKPELLKRYASLADSAADPLVALNTAYAKDGYFLYVPKNTIFKKPLQLVNFLRADQDSFVTQRNFIYVDEGAEVKIISCEHTLNLNAYLCNTVTEIYVGANANFEYYTLQNQNNKTTSMNSVFVHQERDSRASTLFSSLHGGLIRNNLRFVLGGENAEANMFGMAFIDQKQHVDNFTQVVHEKPHCQSNQIYKNVLNHHSTGAFTGQITVKPDAQKTNAFQRNNNLLLTDHATMQTKPQLIIDADDVKCSHGATVGQIDEEALFYLRSRGIDEDQARLMMMNAFAHEVIQQISVVPFRKRIDSLVDKALRGEVARCHENGYNC